MPLKADEYVIGGVYRHIAEPSHYKLVKEGVIKRVYSPDYNAYPLHQTIYYNMDKYALKYWEAIFIPPTSIELPKNPEYLKLFI